MRLTCSAAFWALFASTATAPGVQAKGLRRKLIAKNDCTIMAIEPLALEGGEEPDMILECELNAEDAGGVSGISAPIQATAAQLKELKDLIKSGELAAGEDILDIEGDEIDENHQIKIEPTVSMKAKAQKLPKDQKEKKGKSDKRRRLVDTTGNLKMLLVKVTDSGGLTYPDDATTMSDEVFGTGVDPVNLKSGLEECSWDKLKVLPKALTQGGFPDDTHEVATGVVEVTIDISLTDQRRGTIRNAITTKVQNMLGYGLPGPYDYVLYSVEKCYVDCGWAAYAYINSWNSVYQGVYYKRPGVLMHELGHNFGLAHSGGLNGATYTDHTCTMGNPHYSDDAFQCFNPAKNFQLKWYDDAEITEDPRTQGYTNTLTLVGIDEYPDRGDSPVTVRLETGGGADYFVGFNRASATGPNRMNDEGDNQVTIVQVNGNSGESYSQSFLKAKLSQGQSYAITNYAGTGKTVTITATSIDISTTPGTAVVYISDGLVPAPPSPPPTPAPVTPACEGSDPDTCGCDAVKQNDYRGNISTTEDGYTCMNWESQSPHSHSRTAANYPGMGLGNHNYCRNPDGEARAWCYTTDPSKRWSVCDVPSCTSPSTPSPTSPPAPSTPSPTPSPTSPPTPSTPPPTPSPTPPPTPSTPPPTPSPTNPTKACEGSDPDTCGCDVVKQNDYRGNISTTEDGYTCMNWESQSPHSHSRTAANYPDKGLGNHNYCRNPDGEPRAWCYTTDPDKRWTYCDVPSCTPPPTTTTTTTTSTTTTTTTGTTVASTTTSTQLPTCNTPELTDLDVLDLRTVLKDANSDCETALSKKKVLMIGIDGLRADVVGMTPLPHIARLKNMGTHSFWADVQSTASAVSGPGWASMFTGVEPTKHKVDGNGDLTDLASPTVFKTVKDAFDMKIAASVSWHPLVNDFIDNEDDTTLDDSFLASNDNTMAAKAKDWILSEAYDFVFVDFDGADAAGHSLGFDGYLESYQNRVVEIDALVGTLLDAVMETSAGEEWLIVLTSDHGGEGTSHSAYDKYNRKIPFIVASNSPRVDVGFMPLADPGSQMDVLPTIMYFLGGESAIPDGLDGQVFGFKEYTRAPPPPPPGSCIPDANNCGCASEKQADYRGNIAVTASGKTCQAWSSQSPHSHDRTAANYPNSGLDANYCRNPDGEPSAWCYTTDSGSRWELCEVPTCDTA